MYWAVGEVIVEVSRGGCVCLLEVFWVVWGAEVLVPGHWGVRSVGSVLYGMWGGGGRWEGEFPCFAFKDV